MTAAARWQQHGGCGGFVGTVCECADARTFERHRCANIRVFLLGRKRRDHSVNGIVVIGSDGGDRGNVHCGRQCASAADNDAANDDDANANANGDANDIVC